MTRWLAPPLKALAGVATRFWSPMSAPAGRTPGVTTRKLSGTFARMAAASRGEDTTPSMPAFKA